MPPIESNFIRLLNVSSTTLSMPLDDRFAGFPASDFAIFLHSTPPVAILDLAHIVASICAGYFAVSSLSLR